MQCPLFLHIPLPLSCHLILINKWTPKRSLAWLFTNDPIYPSHITPSPGGGTWHDGGLVARLVNAALSAPVCFGVTDSAAIFMMVSWLNTTISDTFNHTLSHKISGVPKWIYNHNYNSYFIFITHIRMGISASLRNWTLACKWMAPNFHFEMRLMYLPSILDKCNPLPVSLCT